MKRAIAIADRTAALSLALIAAANLLFVLAFLIVTMMATGSARGQDLPTCTGSDLLAEIAADDPDLAAAIRTKADETENGEGLLWTIDKPGKDPSWLFGTMHMTDSRVTELTPQASEAFEAASTVVIETTDVLDQAGMTAALMKKPELMMFTDGTTWPALLSDEDRSAVEAALAERGLAMGSVAMMKPWVLSSMVALPACEIARQTQGAPILDIKLADDAKAAGKDVEGLETAVEQLEAMASLSMEFHLEGLVETLKLGDRIDDVMETMIVLYEDGRTGTIWPLFDAVLPSGDTDPGYAAFEEAMITTRNATMAERAEPYLAAGGAFMAVGALHLPGPDGLVAKLRAAGYEVTRAD